jgi:hypothetical protein
MTPQTDDPAGKMFLIYDLRAACGGDTDEAMVLATAHSLKEARRDARDQGGGAIFQYDLKGSDLVNERWIEDVQ